MTLTRPTTAPAAVRYKSLEIASPGAEETLWNIEGVLNVSLSLSPALQPGHQVRVYFDGNPQMVSGTSFQLQNVYRGVHNLQAEVLDETGKMMIRSGRIALLRATEHDCPTALGNDARGRRPTDGA